MEEERNDEMYETVNVSDDHKKEAEWYTSL